MTDDIKSSSLATVSIRPFLPGGRAYEASKAFYQALGFILTFDAGEVAGFDCGCGGFLLQNASFPGWDDNFMMQLVVEDLDAWWAHIQALDLSARFDVPAPQPPTRQPWGLVIAYLVDPCGVLWHVTQK